MPEVRLTLGGNFEQGAKSARESWAVFMTGLNQGLSLIENLGGRAFTALDNVFTTTGKSEQMAAGLDTLSGSAGAAAGYIEKMSDAAHGTIGSMDAMRLANNALLLGVVKNSDEMEELTEIAVKLGRTMGVDTTQAVESLVIGIGRQSRLWLDNLGIIIDTEQAYEDYAVSIGKTKGELTDLEQKQAFLNATLEAGREKVQGLGSDTLTTAEKWSAVKIQFEESRLEAQALASEALDPLVDKLGNMAGLLPTLAHGVRDVSDGFFAATTELREYAEAHSSFTDASADKAFWKDIAAAVLLTADALEEEGLAAIANAQANEQQAKFIEMVNAALGSSIDNFEEAARAARTHRETIKLYNEEIAAGVPTHEEARAALAAHMDAVFGVSEAQEYATLSGKDLKKANQELAESMGLTVDQLELIGITANNTPQALRAAAGAAVDAFEIARESGEFSAERLKAMWVDDVAPAIIDAYGEIPEAFADTNAEIVGSVQQWIDATHAQLNEQALQESITDPVEQAFLDAFLISESATGRQRLETGAVQFGEVFAESASEEFMSFLASPEGAQQFSEIMTDWLGGVDRVGASGGGRGGGENNQLSEDQSKALDKLFGEFQKQADRFGGTTEGAATGIDAAEEAFKKGDYDWLQRMVNSLRQNIHNYQTEFKHTPQGDAHVKEWGQQIEAILDAAKILGIPVFGKGGMVAGATLGLLGELGSEAVVPLEESGPRVRDAIMGGDVTAVLMRIEAILAQLVGVTADVGMAVREPASPAAMERGKLATSRADRQWKPDARTIGRPALAGMGV